MFDTINGLPVHALVLHATVILLPLMSLVTLAVAVVPRWRGGATIAVAVIDAALIGLTWVTIESGEVLQDRLSPPEGPLVAADHGELGEQLLYFAIALFAVSLLVALFARRGGLVSGVVIVLALGVGVALAGWTIRVGDSGARVVWEDVVENTEAPAST